VPVSFSDWRPGDQKVYISDIRKAGRMLGWVPRVSVEQGVPALHEWIAGHEEQIMKAVLAAPTGST
jgi:CDP-paratose 2-epimerase